MYRESVRFVVIHAEICLLGSDACQLGLPHASCLMPRRHRDASAMRPSTDSYANDIMRRFQFREPGTGSATGTVLRRSSGRIVMTDFNLTEFLHVILSLCHNSQRRRRRVGRMRKRGAANRTGVGVLKRRQVLPLPFRECGSGIMCHGSVRMQRRDTFGGIWRRMRLKTRRRGRVASFLAVSCIRMSFAGYLPIT